MKTSQLESIIAKQAELIELLKIWADWTAAPNDEQTFHKLESELSALKSDKEEKEPNIDIAEMSFNVHFSSQSDIEDKSSMTLTFNTRTIERDAFNSWYKYFNDLKYKNAVVKENLTTDNPTISKMESVEPVSEKPVSDDKLCDCKIPYRRYSLLQ